MSMTQSGDLPISNIKLLELIWVAKFLINSQREQSSLLYSLYGLKCILLHQQSLGEERYSDLNSEFLSLNNDIKNRFQELNSQEKFEYFSISAFMHVFYYQYDLASDIINQFCQELGVDVEFSGVLGRKMRYQIDEISQLVVKVRRNSDLSFCKDENLKVAMPKISNIKDDSLMNKIMFKNTEIENFELSVEEQSLLIAICENHYLTNPKDQITNEECLSYLQKVIDQAESVSDFSNPKLSSWPILTQALFERSKREKESARRAERALEQFEELANQFRSEKPVLEERSSCLNTFFLCRMPSIWTIELSQADFLLEVGATRSALDIYTRWERWNQIIYCYTKMGYREKAAEVIRQRLNQGEESPELYCALGDVTKEISHYEKAWELSNKRSARAMRSLAHFYMFEQRNHELAEECFENSLKINNLQGNLWFTYGCCCLQLKHYEKAENAFRRCTQLERDNYEAWNNCASALILNNKRTLALDVYKEAIKCNFESVRVWENILILSAQLIDLDDCLFAYGRLLDLKPKFVDSEVIERMTTAVLDDLVDRKGNKCDRFHNKLLKLISRSNSMLSTNGDVWFCYARLLLNKEITQEKYEKACQAMQKSFVCGLQADSFEQNNCSKLIQRLKAWKTLLEDEPLQIKTDLIFEKQIKAFKQLQYKSIQLNSKIFMARIKSFRDNYLQSDPFDYLVQLEQEIIEVIDHCNSLLT